jgi:signal transduction histidine kinase
VEATIALRDPERLAALRRTGLLDSPPEEAYDRLTRLAAHVLGVPVALVSLVSDDRQFFKSCVGLPEPWASRRGTPLSHSFCQHAVASAEPLIVEDARDNPLVSENLAIRDLDVIAYAGFPLTTAAGEVLGTFCAIDSQPRSWSDDELAFVREMAVSAVTEIELRTAVRDLEDARAEAEGRAMTLRELQAISDAALAHLEIDDLLAELLRRVMGATDADLAAILLVGEDPFEPPAIRAGAGLTQRDEATAVAFGAGLTGMQGAPSGPTLVDDDGLAALGLDPAAPDRIRTLLGVPLVGGGGLAGVLEVGARSPRRFSADDIKLLELAAERAGHAIHNARLYERAQSTAQVLEERLVATLKRQQAESERAAHERGRLLAHVVAAQEDERTRIAHDVHDDYLQSFTAVRMHLERLEQDIGDSAQSERAARLARDVAATTERMRSLVFDLRPPALDWAGIASALRLYLEETREQWGLGYRLDSRLEVEPPSEVRLIVYRIAQEAITNVRKHARAKCVEVTLTGRDGGVLVIVRDDGEGMAEPEAATNRSRSFGVASMRERAQMAGGWWRLETAPGEGTSVEFWVPAPADGAAAPADA